MNIKLFVSHRIDQNNIVLKNEVITPVYCGAMYKKENWQEGVIGDNTGDNISEKRLSFCELTVQYWAWKNIKADYYGLCHYRRYLSFDGKNGWRNEQNQIHVPFMDRKNIRRYSLINEDKIVKFCNKFDAIFPEPADVKQITSMGKKPKTVKELWEAHEGIFFDNGTIDLLLNSIKKVQPQYYDCAATYLNTDSHRGYNCYLIKEDLFNELCKLQYSVMFEMEKHVNKDVLLRYPRTIGYMGEILFGIFQYNLLKKNCSIAEVPLVFFENTNSDINFYKKIQVYSIFKIKNFVLNYFPDWGIKLTKRFYHMFLCEV